MKNDVYCTVPGTVATQVFKAATDVFEARYEKKRVLLCLLGETPAVITETLSLLMKEGIRTTGSLHAFRPTQLRIITTGDGALSFEKDGFLDKLCECLCAWGYDEKCPLPIQLHLIGNLVAGAAINAGTLRSEKSKPSFTLTGFNRPNEGDNQPQLQEDWGSRLVKVEGQGDIRTNDDTEITANYILAQVSELTQTNDCAVHASIAGGRKSMGALLTQVMSLLGREQDTISHVLTNYEFERRPCFRDHINAKEKWTMVQPWLKPDDINDFVGNKIFELCGIEYVRLFALHGDSTITVGKHNAKRRETFSELVCRVQGILSGNLKYEKASSQDLSRRTDGKSRFHLGGFGIELAPIPTAFLALLLAQPNYEINISQQSENPVNFFKKYFDALSYSGDNITASRFLANHSINNIENFESTIVETKITAMCKEHCHLLNSRLNELGLGKLFNIGKVTNEPIYRIGFSLDRISIDELSMPDWFSALKL